VKLYVCWGTFPTLGGHPCRVANEALRDAGHEPELSLAFGWKALPEVLNLTPGRRKVKRLTGKLDVPVLVTDDGEVVQGSRQIADWARANPAAATA
jgi:hypothetical protein